VDVSRYHCFALLVLHEWTLSASTWELHAELPRPNGVWGPWGRGLLGQKQLWQDVHFGVYRGALAVAVEVKGEGRGKSGARAVGLAWATRLGGRRA
jgi:hypothetical protein